MKDSDLALVQNAFAGCALIALKQLGAFEHLLDGSSTSTIARHINAREDKLDVILKFLSISTPWIECCPPGSYRLAGSLRSAANLTHLLDKFLGGYGRIFLDLTDVLCGNVTASTLVDHNCLATAFSPRACDDIDPIAVLCAQMAPTCVLDLGCGSGAFIKSLCLAYPKCDVIGVDQSMEGLKHARQMLDAIGIGNRVSLRMGKAEDIGDILSESEKASVGIIHARSLLNSMFYDGSHSAVTFLQNMRRLFVGRLMFVVDYYSRLFEKEADSPLSVHAVLQDVVQSMSDQGIPPGSTESWCDLYSHAGCVLSRRLEFEGPDGLRTFLHIIKL